MYRIFMSCVSEARLILVASRGHPFMRNEASASCWVFTVSVSGPATPSGKSTDISHRLVIFGHRVLRDGWTGAAGPRPAPPRRPAPPPASRTAPRPAGGSPAPPPPPSARRTRSPRSYRLDASFFRAGRQAGTARHFCLPVLSVAVGSLIGVSRYRVQPSPAQEQALLEHCGHARFVWNLAVEQHALCRRPCPPASC